MSRYFRTAMVVSIMLLGGCMLTASPTHTPISTPVRTATTTLNETATWEVVAPGIERRVYRPHGESMLASLLVLRIDPAQYRFRVHYRPGQPLNVAEWRDGLTEAVAFVNANFFDEERLALGLLITDGVRFGAPFEGYGGMFQVQNGQPRVRSNILEPYTGEALEQAAQGFPVLVANSTQAYTDTTRDQIARRTVVGQDGAGRILLMITPLVGIPLVELSAYLPTTDMGLVNAVNLDGGGSTMMYVNVPGVSEYILSSFDSVPAVLAAYPR